MAFEPFGLVGGLSVGIPSVLVIDQNGNLISNVNTTGNVTANVIRGTTFLYANGDPLNATPAGANTQLQYNDNGVFGASANLVFDSSSHRLTVTKFSTTEANLGTVANLTITGGDAGYVLQTDGLGNLSWVAQSGGGGNGDPGGANTSVQFNDQENFGGSAYFTYNKTTGVLTSNNIVATQALTGTLATAAQPNITSVGQLSNLVMANGGNITNANWIVSDYISGNGAPLRHLTGANVVGVVPAAAVALEAGTVTTQAQPNITSTGILTTLTVSGVANIGNVSNVKIYGGTVGQVLRTDGAGNLSWVTGGGGGNGTPGGTNTQIQFNDAGSFGGSSALTFNSTTNAISATGNITAAQFIGNGSGLTNIAGGNVSGAVGQATVATLATNVLGASQPNITGLGTLTSLSVAGSANLGAIGNITITGGINGYVLQTDGAGHLSWTAQTGGNGGNGIPGGSNTQLQFNNAGEFGGIVDVTYDGSNLSLGSVANIKILGGSANYVLSTDGTGNLSWKEGGTGNGFPNGASNTVQYNANGNFGGSNSFTYNDATGTLSVTNIIASGQGLFNIPGANVTGTVANASYAVLAGTTNVALSAQTVTSSSQPNITQVGTLSGLSLSGNLDSTANLNILGNLFANNIESNNASFANSVVIDNSLTINAGGNLNSLGNVNFSLSPNVTFGSVANLHIPGGNDGYFLQTDGTGNLTWSEGGGGNGSPGGSNTQIQFNDNGAFGASTYLTWDKANTTMQVGGNLIANSMQLGSGIFKWSTNFVYFASTSSSSSGQTIYSIPISGISGVEFEIMATEPAGPSRQFCKISAIYYNGTVQYNEYSTLIINGGVGNYEVDYDPGDIVTPPSLKLKVSPNSSNAITYKMLIQVFAD